MCAKSRRALRSGQQTGRHHTQRSSAYMCLTCTVIITCSSFIDLRMPLETGQAAFALGYTIGEISARVEEGLAPSSDMTGTRTPARSLGTHATFHCGTGRRDCKCFRWHPSRRRLARWRRGIRTSWPDLRSSQKGCLDRRSVGVRKMSERGCSRPVRVFVISHVRGDITAIRSYMHTAHRRKNFEDGVHGDAQHTATHSRNVNHLHCTYNSSPIRNT